MARKTKLFIEALAIFAAYARYVRVFYSVLLHIAANTSHNFMQHVEIQH